MNWLGVDVCMRACLQDMEARKAEQKQLLEALQAMLKGVKEAEAGARHHHLITSL
jgi:uncharacterized coiled-coil protein SlyX